MQETERIAKDFANKIKPSEKGATVVGLYGELGSGKTTFMKYFAASLGVEETIQSPTFVIMRIFDLRLATLSFRHLIHIDAYRLESSEELLRLGWNQLVDDPENLICIEWPERVAEIMPEHIMVKFEHFSENERNISVSLT